MDETRAARLLGSPERRIAVRDIEVRTGTGSTFVVRGYASVAETGYDVYGGPERGGWIETVKRGAFDVTLANKPDVSFLINHEGAPLARTKSGTLQLRSDNTGLESEATIDRRDPEGQALEVKMERGDLDQMSFGFRVTRQSWNEDYTERDITEVNLDNGDVSIVNWPANPATSINLVSARSAVTVLREMELTELRGELGGLGVAELREAQERLGSLVAQMDNRASISVSVCTDEDAENYADGGADEAAEGEPTLSDLVSIAVDLLTQAASGLSQLSATEGGKEKADAVVRRFAQLLAASDVRSAGSVTIGEPSKVIDEVTGQTLKDIVNAKVGAEFVRSEESPTITVSLDGKDITNAAEETPSRSIRSIARYREMYEV